MKKYAKAIMLLPFLGKAILNGEKGAESDRPAVAQTLEEAAVTSHVSPWIAQLGAAFNIDPSQIVEVKSGREFSEFYQGKEYSGEKYFAVKAKDSYQLNSIFSNYSFKSRVDEITVILDAEEEEIIDSKFFPFYPNFVNLSFYGKNVKTVEFSCSTFSDVKNLDVSLLENLMTINLEYCQQIENIKLNPSITTIGDNFLAEYKGKLDLSQLKNLQTIGDNFLAEYKGELDLSQLKSLETIGNNFLTEYLGENIDLSQLKKLKTIGNNFLITCKNLTTVNFGEECSLKQIGNDFLFRCKNLTTVNLSGLCNLEHIERNFLLQCTSLKKIDLSPLKKLKYIGSSCLSDCANLCEINVNSLNNVKYIGSQFARLYDRLWNVTPVCKNLTSFNIGGLDPENKMFAYIRNLILAAARFHPVTITGDSISPKEPVTFNVHGLELGSTKLAEIQASILEVLTDSGTVILIDKA